MSIRFWSAARRLPVLVRASPTLTVRRMHIQSIPMVTHAGDDNYAYLVFDDRTRDAVIIDPATPSQTAIAQSQINLKAIVNTHHHRDHAGGNTTLRRELGTPELEIIGGEDCEAVTRTLAHGETFALGDITFRAVRTPCHTRDSICWFAEDAEGRCVFTGDTLFIGGCGRFMEGSAADMHEALNVRLASLPDDTKIYCGHEYTKTNSQFGVSVVRDNATEALEAFVADNTETTGKVTIATEKRHNVFMRVDDPLVQDATGETDPVAVMAKLRIMKNKFR